MVDIPPEIWLNIARFLSREELIGCMGVNSLFFYLAMDVLYNEMVLHTGRSIECMQMLDNLSDPLIGNRVQRLVLFLYVNQGTTSTTTEIEQPNRSTRFRRYLRRITQIFKFLRCRKRRRPTQRHVACVAKSPDFEEIMSRFIACSPNLSKISDLTVQAWFMPISYDSIPLFTSIWTAFGTQLHTLSLDGHMEHYRGLLESNPSLPQLKELRLGFNNSFRETPYPPVNSDHIAAFVNQLSPHLQVLKVRSWFMVDLSDMFAQLCIFPSLVHLDVNMPFNTRQDSVGVHNFLLNASHTLRKLSLRLNPSETSNAFEAFDIHWKKWFSDCRADTKCFSELQTLEIYPTILENGIHILRDFICCVSKTLEEFSLREQKLSQNNALLVIGALSQCTKLTVLRLSVCSLTITLFDQLAIALPNLEKLWILLGDLLDDADQVGPSSVFFGALKERSYTAWKLKDLSIWQSGWGQWKADYDVMVAVGRSIPSLSSFFGDGHMDPSSCE